MNCIGDLTLIIALYVDDLISNHLDKLKATKSILSSKFEMTDLGDIHYFLGIQIQRNRKIENIASGAIWIHKADT
jgi:Reverse transcriptase (RNA-dependent DNA polymerase)